MLSVVKMYSVLDQLWIILNPRLAYEEIYVPNIILFEVKIYSRLIPMQTLYKIIIIKNASPPLIRFLNYESYSFDHRFELY